MEVFFFQLDRVPLRSKFVLTKLKILGILFFHLDLYHYQKIFSSSHQESNPQIS